MKRQVFYSFHYGNDAMRVQQIRNMGVIDGNPPVSPNEWEQVKCSGEFAIRRWIDDNMKYRSCVIVLVGSETASRPWVQYEIQKAWADGKGLFGIYIHNLRDPRTGTCVKGANPFSYFKYKGNSLADYAPCYDPNWYDAYNDIRNNIESWIERAISIRKYF